MNSENSPTPESDNTNFEPIESSDELQSEDKPTIKATSDVIADIWSEDDVIDVPIEAESAEIDFTAENPESELSEFELSASTLDTELAEDSESSIDPESQFLEESPDEPELFVDRWLDEPSVLAATDNIPQSQNQAEITDEVEQLERRKANLHQEIEQLKTQKEQILLQQAREVQEHMGRMVEEGTKELKERKMALQIEIEKLERRRERINQEMRSNFAGSSQELAVRVQGFKDYLVGSLQDLATAAEKLELARVEAPASRSRERVRSRDPRRDERERGSRRENERSRSRNPSAQTPQSQFSEPTFADQSRRIQQLLNQYRNKPDYYGSPWQLRRTFEANQAKKVQDWFFVQGGRGAVDSMGSRLQNILVASAAISILHSLYGDRCRILVLTDTPENLGEWRRGLQDCLGISRSNFGANRGVVLFDSPEILVQRAERLLADKLLPMIIIDETEELLNLSMLKFPLWLAFASTNKSTSANYLY